MFSRRSLGHTLILVAVMATFSSVGAISLRGQQRQELKHRLLTNQTSEISAQSMSSVVQCRLPSYYRDTLNYNDFIYTDLAAPLREELLPSGMPYLTSTDNVDKGTGYVTYTIEAHSDTTVTIAGSGTNILYFEPGSSRGGNTDSFYVSMDGGKEAIWTGFGSNTKDFDKLTNLPGTTVCTKSSGCSNSNGKYSLKKGLHTLKIRIRENGASMKGMAILDGDAGFCPARDPTAAATPQGTYTELTAPLREELLPSGIPYLTSTDKVDKATGYVTYMIEARSDTTVTIAGSGTNILYFEPGSSRGGNTDSFYVSMDGGKEAIWTGFDMNTKDFGKQTNLPGTTVCTKSSGCGDSNGKYSLKKGLHTLKIRIRENGASMKALLTILDGDAGFRPTAPSLHVSSFGEPCNVTQICDAELICVPSDYVGIGQGTCMLEEPRRRLVDDDGHAPIDCGSDTVDPSDVALTGHDELFEFSQKTNQRIINGNRVPDPEDYRGVYPWLLKLIRKGRVNVPGYDEPAYWPHNVICGGSIIDGSQYDLTSNADEEAHPGGHPTYYNHTQWHVLTAAHCCELDTPGKPYEGVVNFGTGTLLECKQDCKDWEPSDHGGPNGENLATECKEGCTTAETDFTAYLHGMAIASADGDHSIFKISERRFHPCYRNPRKGETHRAHDVCVATFDATCQGKSCTRGEDAPFSSLNKPIELASVKTDEMINLCMRVVGWGLSSVSPQIGYQQPNTLSLREVDLPVVSIISPTGAIGSGGSCQGFTKNGEESLIPTVDGSNICFDPNASSVNNKAQCNGDSGGPYVYRQDGQQDYVQTGIVSFGKVNCDSYSIAASVSFYKDWIECVSNEYLYGYDGAPYYDESGSPLDGTVADPISEASFLADCRLLFEQKLTVFLSNMN